MASAGRIEASQLFNVRVSGRSEGSTRRPRQSVTTTNRKISRVLLVSAGTDVTSVGLLHMAAVLRRNDIEAFVATFGHPDPVLNSQELTALLRKLRPELVGISFKWYHHITGALRIASTVKAFDERIVVAIGGNSAAYYARDLIQLEPIDYLIRGDGEQPLLEVCRGVQEPVNAMYRHGDGVYEGGIAYVQRGAIDERIYLSHYEDLFPSKMDLVSSPPFLVGGKGCAQACLYCSGDRNQQRALFGRKGPYLRAPEDVRQDVAAMLPWTGTFCFDFSSEHSKSLSLRAWFEEVFRDIDCSRHSMTFLPWELPADDILDFLAQRFALVRVAVDLGTLSERHRTYLSTAGLFKSYVARQKISNDGILAWTKRWASVENLSLCLTAISGMPFVEAEDFAAEIRFASRILECDNVTLGFEGHRLHFEPGSAVARDSGKFGMVSPINSFDELVHWFENEGDPSSPVMRFSDSELDQRVDEHARELVTLAHAKVGPVLRPFQLKLADDRSLTDEVMALRLKQAADMRVYKFSADEWIGYRGFEGRSQAVTMIGAADHGVRAELGSDLWHSDDGPAAFAGLVDPVHSQPGTAVLVDIIDRFASPRKASEVYSEMDSAAVDPDLFAAFISKMMLLRALGRA